MTLLGTFWATRGALEHSSGPGCPCFCWCSGMAVRRPCFYLHLSHHAVALSARRVLGNCLCSTGEYHGLVVRARPAPGCQGPFCSSPVLALFMFSASWYLCCESCRRWADKAGFSACSLPASASCICWISDHSETGFYIFAAVISWPSLFTF